MELIMDSHELMGLVNAELYDVLHLMFSHVCVTFLTRCHVKKYQTSITNYLEIVRVAIFSS